MRSFGRPSSCGSEVTKFEFTLRARYAKLKLLFVEATVRRVMKRGMGMGDGPPEK